ncbi:MAG TPA: hypothetical protein VK484_11145 [Ferruginibacter sp.]|nr:hypothetical protein [Ferruginibacter sp.]
MSKKTTELALTEEQKAILDQSYPVSEESNRLQLPRLGLLSKDIVEESGTGKNKKIKVLQAAGYFYTESDKGETNEEGKKVWTKEFIEDETIDVTIVYHRYQLRKYDSSLEKFISSPIYDNAEQVIPLYLDKQVIKRGTEADLQKLYPALTQKGKPTSDLKKEVILYVLFNGELHQLNLSQSSKWEFMSYKKQVNPSTVITTLSSTEETFGTNTYRKMMFNVKRPIGQEEFELVFENQSLVKTTVENDSKFLLASGTSESEQDKEFDRLAAKAEKDM